MENLSGQSIKGYELHERIGAGGFGAVYKAYQSTVGREVAIKIILPHFANQPDFIRRFETEAQLVARLEHLHIIPLYDYWRDPDGAYLVMRWLKGGSLRDALKNGAFSPESAALLLDQISSALAAAHRSHVIHRDLKPGNILLDEDGNAYLADFGIAKDIDHQHGVSEPDAIVGSPDYLAPEQARSEPVTPRTDIYSLGVVLYEMLTGEHPFPNLNMVERLFKHLSEPLPEITTLHESIRVGVNEIIQKATAKNPLHRYADVLEMASAFRQAARTESGSVVETLTQREQQILGQIIEGRSNKEIAQELFVTVMTVKWHITQIYHKLGVRSRVQAIIRARELHLINVPEEYGSDLSISEVGIIPTDQFQPKNPYKGLRAFQSADNQDFFGREKLVEKLVKRMSEGGAGLKPTAVNADDLTLARFLAVIGPSGSGKSSLVKAGLIPAIWHGDLPGSEKWFVIEMMPSTHPLDELEIALTRIAANQSGNLHEQLERDKRGLIRAAHLTLPNDGSELLVVIDQFEEVFTLVESESERVHFLDLLCTAVTEARSRVRVVITLRADFYDRPLHYPEFGELVRSRMETVLPLSAEGLERAIARPAERVGVNFEPGLVSAIIGEINYQTGALPLLQYALTELFENRRGHTLTQEAYQSIGRTTGALAKRADEIYLSLDDAGKEAIRQMFLRLVTLGEGVEDTRRRVPRSELLALTDNLSLNGEQRSRINFDSDVIDEVIDTYVNYRLLSLDNDPTTRAPTVEVAHEAILREWERLRVWLNESREDIRLQRQVSALAAEWRSTEQDTSFLLRGSRLEVYERWLQSTQLALTEKEREYIHASLAQHTKEVASEESRHARELQLAHEAAEQAQKAAASQKSAANRLRYLVAFLGIFLLVTATLSVVTLQSRDNAINSFNQSESQRLAAESSNAIERGDSPELAALLAIRGLQSQYSPQADAALQRASRLYYGEHVFDTEERVSTVAFSSDGRYALTEGSIRTILWDVQTGTQVHSFTVNFGNLGSAAFSPDGQYIIVGDDVGTVHVWETATGLEAYTSSPTPSSPVPAPINCVAYSPDGRFILAASADHIVYLMDSTTGTVIRTFDIGGNPGGIAFSPDSRRFAVSNMDSQTGQVWDVETGTQIWSATVSVIYTGVAYSPDGQYVLATSFDKKSYLLDAATGEEIREFVGHTEGVFSGTFSPDSQYVLTSSLDQTARLWDTATGEEVRRFLGHTASVYAVAFSPDGRHILTGSKDSTARLWDIQSSSEQGTFSGGQGWMYGLAFSADGQYVLTGTNDSTAHLFDSATGTLLHVFTHPNIVQQVFFSPDNSMILTGNADGIARLWNVASGEIVRTFDQGVSTAYSPDGRFVLTNGTTTTLWDALSGDSLYTVAQRPGGMMVFSSDSQYFAVTNEETQLVSRYETATGTLLNTIVVPNSPLAGVFSPDNQYILTGSRDNIVRLWDAESGELVRQFVGHTNIAWMVAFSPDGRTVLSGGLDRTARLWDVATGAQLRTFPSHNFSAVSMVAYSPDSQSVLIGSSDGTTQLADVELDSLTQSVCARLLRDFTDTERTIYGITDQNPTCANVEIQPTTVAPTWTPVLIPTGA